MYWSKMSDSSNQNPRLYVVHAEEEEAIKKVVAKWDRWEAEDFEKGIREVSFDQNLLGKPRVEGVEYPDFGLIIREVHEEVEECYDPSYSHLGLVLGSFKGSFKTYSFNR